MEKQEIKEQEINDTLPKKNLINEEELDLDELEDTMNDKLLWWAIKSIIALSLLYFVFIFFDLFFLGIFILLLFTGVFYILKNMKVKKYYIKYKSVKIDHSSFIIQMSIFVFTSPIVIWYLIYGWLLLIVNQYNIIEDKHVDYVMNNQCWFANNFTKYSLWSYLNKVSYWEDSAYIVKNYELNCLNKYKLNSQQIALQSRLMKVHEKVNTSIFDEAFKSNVLAKIENLESELSKTNNINDLDTMITNLEKEVGIK